MTKLYIVARKSALGAKFEASGFYEEKGCYVFYETRTRIDGSKVNIDLYRFRKNDVANIRCIFKGR